MNDHYQLLDLDELLREIHAWGLTHKRSCAERSSNFQVKCACGRDALSAKLNAAIFEKADK